MEDNGKNNVVSDNNQNLTSPDRRNKFTSVSNLKNQAIINFWEKSEKLKGDLSESYDDYKSSSTDTMRKDFRPNKIQRYKRNSQMRLGYFHKSRAEVRQKSFKKFKHQACQCNLSKEAISSKGRVESSRKGHNKKSLDLRYNVIGQKNATANAVMKNIESRIESTEATNARLNKRYSRTNFFKKNSSNTFRSKPSTLRHIDRNKRLEERNFRQSKTTEDLRFSRHRVKEEEGFAQARPKETGGSDSVEEDGISDERMDGGSDRERFVSNKKNAKGLKFAHSKSKAKTTRNIDSICSSCCPKRTSGPNHANKTNIQAEVSRVKFFSKPERRNRSMPASVKNNIIAQEAKKSETSLKGMSLKDTEGFSCKSSSPRERFLGRSSGRTTDSFGTVRRGLGNSKGNILGDSTSCYCSECTNESPRQRKLGKLANTPRIQQWLNCSCENQSTSQKPCENFKSRDNIRNYHSTHVSVPKITRSIDNQSIHRTRDKISLRKLNKNRAKCPVYIMDEEYLKDCECSDRCLEENCKNYEKSSEDESFKNDKDRQSRRINEHRHKNNRRVASNSKFGEKNDNSRQKTRAKKISSTSQTLSYSNDSCLNHNEDSLCNDPICSDLNKTVEFDLYDLSPDVSIPEHWSQYGVHWSKVASEYRKLTGALKATQREAKSSSRKSVSKKITRKYPSGKEFCFEVKSAEKKLPKCSDNYSMTESEYSNDYSFSKNEYPDDYFDLPSNEYLEDCNCFSKDYANFQRSTSRTTTRSSSRSGSSIKFTKNQDGSQIDCECSQEIVEKEEDPVRKLETFCEKVKAINKSIISKNPKIHSRSVIETRIDLDNYKDTSLKNRGESDSSILFGNSSPNLENVRIARPENCEEKTSLKKILIFPPEGVEGPPLALYKNSSNINCQVKGDINNGFQYSVTYVQKFVSPTWRPTRKRVECIQERKHNCECTDYG
ncbi:uncharacterized protein [Prorops nasuta]|uniref:uncharacterized protein n=1 Tax=Prorops nasuta TaxID=863751 RepID=UPI0034CD6D06